jgi:transcriptional regulator of acetoin/glycerol metabolism
VGAGRARRESRPGRRRELQNALEFAALQAGEADVDLARRPPELRYGAGSGATRRLGISRVTLWKRLKRVGG